MTMQSVALRDAIRSLRTHKLFAVMAALSLGFALALNTTMFAIVDAQLNPVRPFPDSERLFTVTFQGGDRRTPISQVDALRSVAEALSGIAQVSGYSWAIVPVQATLTTEDRSVALVDRDVFDVIGVRPQIGRFFDDETSSEAIISYTLWRRYFSGRPLSDELHLTVGSRTFTVVGIMPRGMHEPAGANVWLPRDALAGETLWFLRQHNPLLRLRPGVTQAQAESQLDIVTRRLDHAHGTPGWPVTAKWRSLVSPPRQLQTLFQTLVVAAAVVLLVACTNLATLILARSSARVREIALRVALGATRGTILRSVLLEIGLLAAAGAVVGLVLTTWALQTLGTQGVRYLAELGDVPPIPGPRIFLFMLLIAAVAMLLTGLLPALRAAATPPATPLKDGGGTSTVRLSRRHQLLVVSQVAFSTALVMTTVLFADAILRMRAHRFPFDARDVVTAELRVNPRFVPDGADVERIYRTILERTSELPDAIASATHALREPAGVVVTAESGPSGTRWLNLPRYHEVSPAYLRVIGVPVAAGRDFAEGDRVGPGVAIVNAAAARALWPDVQDPVGRMIKLGRFETDRPWLRVIGVTGQRSDIPQLATDAVAAPAVYVVPRADSSRARTLFVRGAGDPAVLAVLVRRELHVLMPRGASRAEPYLKEWLQQIAMTRLMLFLFGAAAMFALLLSALGLYSVLLYMVGRRVREFAVRFALGADSRQVATLVVREAAVLTLAGVGVGAFVALTATRGVVQQLLFPGFVEVRALVVAELVLFTAAALASLGPLRRAIRADPVEILRAT